MVHEPEEAAEIPFETAAVSWYDKVYFPIIEIIRETSLLARFPQCTEADLYVFVGQHWSELGRRYGPLFTLEEAAEDFSIVSREGSPARRWRRGAALGLGSSGGIATAGAATPAISRPACRRRMPLRSGAAPAHPGPASR